MDRVPRLLFLALTAGVLAWQVMNVPWETRYYAPGQSRSSVSYVHAATPLWAGPSPLSVSQLAALWPAGSELRFDPAGRTETGVHWEFLVVGVLATWALLAGLLWPIFLLGRLRPSWGRAMRFSLGLFAGAALCFGLWLVFGGWGPPLPLFFALLGVFLGWLWSRRPSESCES